MMVEMTRQWQRGLGLGMELDWVGKRRWREIVSLYGGMMGREVVKSKCGCAVEC